MQIPKSKEAKHAPFLPKVAIIVSLFYNALSLSKEKL
jgi:hypothetical protein